MQKFIATGRTTKDVEIRYSADGKPVARFDFAVGKRFKREGEKDDFFSCVAFGTTAENLEKLNVAKGTKLLIDGEVHNNNYEKQDGTKVYATQITVLNFEFCEKKSTGENDYVHQDRPQPSNSDGFMNIPDGIDEELPFN